MKNFLSLIFLLSICAWTMGIPVNNDGYNTALYRGENSGGSPRAYPQYYYYPDPAPVQRRQDEILDTSQRVYSPIFRYRKKQEKQSKRRSYPYRKASRIMPAYLI